METISAHSNREISPEIEAIQREYWATGTIPEAYIRCVLGDPGITIQIPPPILDINNALHLMDHFQQERDEAENDPDY